MVALHPELLKLKSRATAPGEVNHEIPPNVNSLSLAMIGDEVCYLLMWNPILLTIEQAITLAALEKIVSFCHL